MKRWWTYAVASTAVVGLVVALLWSGLDGPGREGILWAAGVALPVQWAAFALLVGLRERKQGFLLALAGGTMARLGVLGAAGVVVTVVETGVGVGALILGLAGFLFVLALLEAFFLRGGTTMRQPG
ncbi:MAG: hypothetical protein KJO11_03585 [Gemmatimonadetes bacterium]|nr:hypothetical protein [Gemmatimonadota bacterium]MBT8404183.1 hypothetical protein [Gemmatimonadota bacterium]NNK64144.1 hypothetical protein [Gemmatimonadota bacterium]